LAAATPSTPASSPPERREPRDAAQPPQPSNAARRGARWFTAIDGWRGLAWLACGVAVGAVINWLVFRSSGDVGSEGEWFFGAGVFAAVAVVVWQTVNLQRQAKEAAADAAERLRTLLAAAEERSARELAAAEERFARELALTQSLHRAEIEAQRELARVDRIHLLAELQKHAIMDVSRVVSAHARLLAALWNQGASILCIEDRDAREEALNPIFEQIGQVVDDFSVEVANAHLLVDDDRLHEALNGVNEAVLMAMRVAEEVHVAIVEGRGPHPNAIGPVQRLMYKRAAEARHLAWDLLRINLGDGVRPPDPDGLGVGGTDNARVRDSS
jgi:hypothetical protein